VHLLGLPEPYVLGLLEYLWKPAYECGDARIGDQMDVELAAKWPGEEGKFFQAVMACGGEGRAGFIEPVPGEQGQYQIHDLFDHAPDYVRSRKRMEESRKRKCSEQLRNGYASPAPAPAPNTSPNGEVCSEPAEPASEPAVPTATDNHNSAIPPTDVKPRSGRREDRGGASPGPGSSLDPAGDPVVLRFPVVGGKRRGGPAEWPLTAAKVAEYAEAFPGVDVSQECRAALQWCRDNPKKRKTPEGMPAFLARWLAKEQNRGGPRPRAPAGDGVAAETTEQYAARMKAEREEEARRRAEASQAPSMRDRGSQARKGAP
jgi:hypothetical protein